MGKTMKGILLLLLVLAVTFGTEVCCQAPLLLSGEKGVTALDLSGVTLSEAVVSSGDETFPEDEYDDAWDEWADEEWDESAGDDMPMDDELPDEDAADSLTAQNGQSITLPVGGFVQTLTLTGEVSTENAAYTVQCLLPDGSVWQMESFFWVMDGDSRDSVNIGRRVDSVTLTFPESSFTLQAAEKDNRFKLDPYRMLLISLTTLGAGLLILCRREIGRKAELGFLIVALCAGLILSIGQPAVTGNTYDDEIHYGRIAALSHGTPGYLTAAESLLTERGFSVVYDEAYHYEADTLQDQQRVMAAMNRAGEDQTAAVDVPLHLAFSDTGYVLQALGHALARLLGLPLSAQLTMARVFNMLGYVLLCYLGIRSVKRFKIALSAIALMPTPMFSACSLTYDATINALCLLGTALVVDAILDRETRLKWQRGLGILLALVLGAISKVVYAPLLLLVLLLPRKKFDSNAARVWYKTLAVALCILMVLTMVLSVSGGAVTLTDSRGDAADSAGQISYLMHHPVTYLVTFLRTIWTGFEGYFLTGTRTDLGYSGAALSTTVALLSLMLIIFAVVTDHDPSLPGRMNWKQRTAMLVVAMLTIGMTFTTMYVAYTAVGADYISGVQGRYLIPVLPLLVMLCSPEGIHNRMNRTAWHTTFFLLSGAVLLNVCWQIMGRYSL